MKKRTKTMLSSFTILVLLTIAVGLVTYLIPDVTNATLAQIIMAPVKGFSDASADGQNLIGFIMCIGGFLGIVNGTGALDNGIKALVHKLNGKEEILIAVLMFIFSIGGTTYGMCEETVPFYVMVAATMVTAGFDTIVAAAVVGLGAGVGVLGSTINPFCTMAALAECEAAGVAVDSGLMIILGVIVWLTSYATALFFVLKYVKKLKADKGSTLLSLQEQEEMKKEFADENSNLADVKVTGNQKAVLVLFAFTFIVMIVGLIPWDTYGIEIFLGWSDKLMGAPLGWWYFDEVATLFLLMSIVVGFVSRTKEKDFIKNWMGGAADLVSVALIIATARGISVLMSATGLGDYLVVQACELLKGVPAALYAPLAYLIYLPLSFLVPSTSGLASLSMGIVGPVTVELGFSVEVIILIFSAANGLMNLCVPTAGALMGGLASSRVQYPTWLKFVWKVVLAIAVVNVITLTIAMLVL